MAQQVDRQAVDTGTVIEVRIQGTTAAGADDLQTKTLEEGPLGILEEQTCPSVEAVAFVVPGSCSKTCFKAEDVQSIASCLAINFVKHQQTANYSCSLASATFTSSVMAVITFTGTVEYCFAS